MKTLSIHQPYASLIMLGHKRIETRSWYTLFRGTIYVQAAKKFSCPRDADFLNAIESTGLSMDDLKQAPRGAIIGKVDIVDCVRMKSSTRVMLGATERQFGHYQPGYYMWILKNPKPLKEPYFCRGHRGLWEEDISWQMLNLHFIK